MPGKRQRARSPSPSPSSSLASSDPGFGGDASESEDHDPKLASVIAVCRWLENPVDDADVAELSSRVGWSQRHLRRIFKEVTGVTIAAYARGQRAERAHPLI